MNVFENVEFLCGNEKGCNDLINRFLDVANDIKGSLGEKSKLLDEYLMVVFEAINSIDILSPQIWMTIYVQMFFIHVDVF